MKLSRFQDWVKRYRKDIAGWAMLVGWVLVLWAMASKYWHALKFFYWIAIFSLVPLVIIFAFKFMWKGETAQAGTKAEVGPAPVDDVDKIV